MKSTIFLYEPAYLLLFRLHDIRLFPPYKSDPVSVREIAAVETR